MKHKDQDIINLQTHIHTHTHTDIYIYIYTEERAAGDTYGCDIFRTLSSHIHTPHAHVYTLLHTHTHTQTHTQTHTHTDTHILTHMCVFAFIRSSKQWLTLSNTDVFLHLLQPAPCPPPPPPHTHTHTQTHTHAHTYYMLHLCYHVTDHAFHTTAEAQHTFSTYFVAALQNTTYLVNPGDVLWLWFNVLIVQNSFYLNDLTLMAAIEDYFSIICITRRLCSKLEKSIKSIQFLKLLNNVNPRGRKASSVRTNQVHHIYKNIFIMRQAA